VANAAAPRVQADSAIAAQQERLARKSGAIFHNQRDVLIL
jgi:hypothetical protein